MKHILEDNKHHHYVWDFKNRKAKLYIDGKLASNQGPMTLEYWFKGSSKKKSWKSYLQELQISKCSRKKK
jgi:hypothetical protein